MLGKTIFVVGKVVKVDGINLAVEESDKAISGRLEKLGFEVETVAGSDIDLYLASKEELIKKELVVLSSTAVSEAKTAVEALSAKLCDLSLPVVVLGYQFFSGMRMCRDEDIETLPDKLTPNSEKNSETTALKPTEITIIHADNMMAAGLSGTVTISQTETRCCVSSLCPDAIKVATLDEKGSQFFLFGYRTDSLSYNKQRFPGRRVGLFFDAQMVMQLTRKGWKLFDGVIAWATKALSFADVFRAEWNEIAERRRICECSNEPPVNRPPENLVGLALSGGGIRSATFSLGLLQGLQQYNLLRIFDYLSTVSGGGYIGGWWSAFLSRKNTFSNTLNPQDFKNVDEIIGLLKTDKGKINSYLTNKFSPANLRLLSKRFITAEARAELLSVELNRILDDEIFLETFKGELEKEELKERARKLNEESDSQQRRRRQNRLILESAFAGELSALKPESDVEFKWTDFNNPERFVGRLLEPLSTPLFDHFSAAEQQIIKAATKARDEKVKVLMAVFNRLLKEKTVLGFNRLILEETYPQLIRGLTFPKPEQLEPQRVSAYLRGREKIFEGSLSAGIDPIHHLRLFSNYLTPRKGLLSGDTWQAVAVVVRNLLLTWVVLLPILFTFVLVGQFYFVLQRNSDKEFLHPFQAEISGLQTAFENLPKKFEAKRERIRDQRDKRVLRRESKTEKIQQNAARALEENEARENWRMKHLPERLAKLSASYNQALWKRFLSALTLVIPMVFWLLVTTLFWLRINVTPQAIVKFTQTIPGIAFWVLVICVICLSTTYNWGDLHKPLAALKADWQELSGRTMLLIIIFWLIGSVALWWASLPFARARWRRLWKEYRWGNLLSLLLTSLMTGLLVLLLLVLNRMARNGNFAAKYFWMGVIGIGVAGCLWFYTLPRHEEKWEWRKLIHGNQIMRVQALLTVGFVVLVLVLALSGYGYEIANYVMSSPSSQKAFTDYLAKAGGWATLIASIAGSIFTAIKASPTGGEDKQHAGAQSPTTRFIISATPILVLISMAIAFAWLSRWGLMQFGPHYEYFVGEMKIPIVVSVALYLFLAVHEIRNWGKLRSIVGILFALGVIAWLCVALTRFLAYRFDTSWTQINGTATIHSQYLFWSPYCYAIGLIILIVGVLIRLRVPEPQRKNLGLLLILGTGCFAGFFCFLANKASFANSKVFSAFSEESATVPVEQSGIFLAGILCCGAVALWEWRSWDGNTKRSILLLSFTFFVLSCFLVFTFFADKNNHTSMTIGYLALGMLYICLTLSVALGWMSDPNLLSLHMFYKSRLMRAYLGASNPNRKSQEITESATGDDLLLRELKNCQKGAPFHLINTTLNLVGGKDLITAQRSSDYFVLSKLFSGSSRTGYRRNLQEQYMQGQMTLGTAVAVSGAAVSPNMGAKTQTSAVAMLLTLLNVRLGFWAPTPNRRLWRSAQAGLWPFYMVKEFLSQTNDLSSYCYLTDGGHFDNTGLYSLVERGCRFIIVSDNGADKDNRFEDLGEAIRRCRIDFQAEINLDVSPLFTKKDDLSGDFFSNRNFIVGTILYSKAHVGELGWTDCEDEEQRTGVIIIIKPSLIEKESVDLHQYRRQNSDFPQQSTSDQWYDEAQFESYRKLGNWCAHRMIHQLELHNSLDKDKPITQDIIKNAFKDGLEAYQGGDKKKVKEAEEETIPFLSVWDA